MKITLVAGTNRPGSNTRRLSAVIESIYSELGYPIHLLDIAQLPPEIFEPASWENPPAAFKRYVDMLATSDGIHFIVPEYHSGLPGTLKHFLDLLDASTLFKGRCVAITGLSGGQFGGVHAVGQVLDIMIAQGCHVFTNRALVPRIGSMLSEDGLLTDEALSKRLRSQAAGFLDFVGKLRGVNNSH